MGNGRAVIGMIDRWAWLAHGPQMCCFLQGRRNEKKARGAENFKKAHCNYFELKPGFIDAQSATASLATNAYTFI